MSDLESMIARLRALGGPAMVERVAVLAAPLVDEAVKKTARAGTDPYGKPWAPRKKDGGRALVNAAEHITTTPHGNLIAVTLEGPDVFHHEGKHGAPQRQVIPDSATDLPEGVTAALREGARRAFEEVMSR